MLDFIEDPLMMRDLPTFITGRAPLFGEAVLQAHQYFQAPYRLCLMTALAAVSTACQFDVMVTTPIGQRVPGQLNVMVIARSGERKSPVEGRFMKSIRACEEVMSNLHGDDMRRYQAACTEWKMEKRLIEKELRRSPGFDGEIDEIKARLLRHLEAKPEEPRRKQLIYQDASPMSLFEGLSGFGIGALVSSEGGMVTEGRLMEAFPHLNEIYSGNSVTVNRARGKVIRLSDVRMSILILIQEAVLDELTGKLAGKVKASGHWARYLICRPPTTQGTRVSSTQSRGTDFMDRFDDRMAHILEDLCQSFENNEFKRREIVFSAEAADYWVQMADSVERQIAPGARYEHAGDHASKLLEIVARVAAIIHYFEGFEGPLSRQTVEMAYEICNECSKDYVEVFARRPQCIEDAEELLEMLKRYRRDGQYPLEKNFARRYCPYKIRSGGRFYRALDQLCSQSVASVCKGNNSKDYILLSDSASSMAMPGLIPFGIGDMLYR